MTCGICGQRGWFKLIKPGSVPPVYMAAWCDCEVGKELRAALANGSPADDRALELLHAAVDAAQALRDADQDDGSLHSAYSITVDALREFIWKQVI